MGFCLDCHQQAGQLPEHRPAANASNRGEASIADDRAEQPALFGSLPANRGDSSSLGPGRHDALTTCSACHR
jgi:hypothetical protein